jgi:hypothetical protein
MQVPPEIRGSDKGIRGGTGILFSTDRDKLFRKNTIRKKGGSTSLE